MATICIYSKTKDKNYIATYEYFIKSFIKWKWVEESNGLFNPKYQREPK